MIKRKAGRPSYASMRKGSLVARELALVGKRKRERKERLQKLVDEVKEEMKKRDEKEIY